MLRPWRWSHFLSLWSLLGPFLHANCRPHRAVESPREPSVRSCAGAASARPRDFRPVQPKRAQFRTAQPTGAQYSPVEPSSLCPGHRAGGESQGLAGTDGWAGRGPRPGVGGGNRGPQSACSVPLAYPPENGYESTFHVTCFTAVTASTSSRRLQLLFAVILLLLQNSARKSNRTKFLQFINP